MRAYRYLYHMRVLVLLFVLRCAAVCAQFELGVGAGAYQRWLIPHDPTGMVSVGSEAPLPTFSLFYNERLEEHGLDLTMSLDHERRSFRVDRNDYNRSGGIDKGSLTYRWDAVCLTVAMDVYLLHDHRLAVRPGMQFGWAVAGRKQGEVEQSGYAEVNGNNTYWSNKRTVNDAITVSGTDVRVLLGLRYRIPLSERVSLLLDPFASIALGNAHVSDGAFRDRQLGLRIGVAYHLSGRPFTSLIPQG